MTPKVVARATFVGLLFLLTVRSLTAEEQKIFAISRTDSPPKIDGRLDDTVWRDAVVIDGLYQNTPRYLEPATEQTLVRLAHDDHYLYISAELRDRDPAGIKATQLIQGRATNSDDRFFVSIDTFNSKRNDYFFLVNANGIRSEALRENNTRFIDDWNTIWHAASQINDWGWSTEIAIPFKSISFDPELDTWGFNFGRWIVRKQEFDILSSNDRLWWAIDNVEMCCISGIQQGWGLDVVPSVNVIQRHDFSPGQTELMLEPTLDVFYKLTPSLSMAVTINTDFSTAEVDEQQVALNRFLLFFPEKRDFFLQDAGIFEFGNLDTNGRPFFSRRIGLSNDGMPIDLVGGGKLTGRLGRFNIGVLGVRQEAYDSIKASTLFVGRLSANVLSESSVGLMVTSGDPTSNDDNTLVGTDFIFRKSNGPFGQIIQGQAWFQKTSTAGISDDNLAYGAGFEFPNDRLRVRLKAMEIQQNFSPALGFVNRAGVRQYESLIRYRTRPDSGRWREVDNQIESILVTDTGGDVLTRETRIRPVSLRSHGEDLLFVEWQRSYEQVRESFKLFDRLEIPEGIYEFDRYRVQVSTGAQRPVSALLSVQFGDFFGGERLEKSVEIQWRQSAHLFLGLSFVENIVELPSGDFTSHLGSLRADIAFNARWSWSNLLQYDNSVEELRFNSRLRFEPEAGREMLLVLDHRSAVTADNRLKSISNEIILKLSYTLRL